MCEPAVVSAPLVQNRSLIANGRPSSGRASPRASGASASAAIASACSGVSVMKALSGRAAATAATCASASSRAENAFLASPSRAAAKVRSVSAVMAPPPSSPSPLAGEGRGEASQQNAPRKRHQTPHLPALRAGPPERLSKGLSRKGRGASGEPPRRASLDHLRHGEEAVLADRRAGADIIPPVA